MNIAIILSDGTGSRIGSELPKQFLKIGKKTVIEYSIEAFEDHNYIDKIIIVSNPDYIHMTEDIVNKNGYRKVGRVVEGGKTRQESSFIGVSLAGDIKNVLIHDAARPFISADLIDRLLDGLSNNNAVVPSVSSPDTLIEIDGNNLITNIPDRAVIQRVQTPQAFDLDTIKKAHELAKVENSLNATDDCSLVLKFNLSDVFVIDGSIDNFKITYPADIKYAESIISRLS